MKVMLSAMAVSTAIGLMAVFAVVPARAEDQARPVARPDNADKSAASGECLRIGNVWDYTPVPGNRALIVTDKARRKYKVIFAGRCTGLQYHMGLSFRSRGTGRLSCLGKGDSVITHDVAGIPVCRISSVVPYTRQMEKADAQARTKAKEAEPADK